MKVHVVLKRTLVVTNQQLTVLFKTTLTWMITRHELLILLGSNHLPRINKESNIEGIMTFVIEHKISQFADDTALFSHNIASVNNAIEILQLFDYTSGLKLNLGKTKAIWLGSWRHMDNKPLGLN